MSKISGYATAGDHSMHALLTAHELSYTVTQKNNKQ